MLLKQLRSGLDKESSTTPSAKAQTRDAAKISDEAFEFAKAEVIHAEPDEFGVDNLEDRLRNILNIPKEEEEAEEEISDTAEAQLSFDFGDEDIEADEAIDEVVKESEDDVPWLEEDNDEIEVSKENDTDEEITEPEYAKLDEEDEALINEVIAQTAVFGGINEENTEVTDESDEATEEDDSFLTKLSLDEPENLEELPEDDFDDFVFVTEDDIKIAEADEPADDGAPVGEDGGREYAGLGGVEMSSTELSLISLFGSEEELEETVGKEKAEEIIRERSEAPIPEAPRKKKFYEHFSPEYEYVSAEQDEEIKSVYSKAFTGATVRFIFCLIFTALLFVLENAASFGLKLPGFLNRDFYPVVVSMINLELVLLAAYTVLGRLVYGFSGLFKFKPTYESVPALLVAASVVYTFALAFFAGVPAAPVYNFPVAAALLFMSFGEILTLKREAMSFDVVSSKRRKFTVRALSDEERNEDALLFTEYVPGDSEMFAVTKTGFVEGFFGRVSKPTYNRMVPVLMIIALAGALISAGVGIYLGKDTYSVINMAFLTFVLTLPGTILFAGIFPFYRISKGAYEGESAIIGTSSIEEYSEGSVVFFDDKDIFPATGVKINSVKVYGENRIDEVIYRAASVFSKIGGPLADVFSLATIDIGHSNEVEILDSVENGVHCTIDGTEIYLGTNEYLISNDFETPYGESDENLEKNGGVRLMFIADANEILAKFYVQYTVDSEYEYVFSQLYKAGMCVGIRTWDPNISEEFIIKKLRLKGDYPVKVIHGKPGRRFYPKVEYNNSGVVSAGSVKSLLKVLSSCDKIKYISKIHGIFEVVSAIVAILAVLGVTLLGKLDLGSMYAALYQIFWLVPIMLVAMFAD